MLRSSSFITTSVPFALGLTAQVGFLTHQISFLSPMIRTVAAGWAVSLTTFAAVLGRIATGFVLDRFDRRAVACINFIVQVLAMGILATSTAPAMLYLGCGLFGLGVGNATSLPGLIVQHEFPKQHFSRTVSLVVAINQFSFAFGPTLLGQLERMREAATARHCSSASRCRRWQDAADPAWNRGDSMGYSGEPVDSSGVYLVSARSRAEAT